jgi:hypothetical protein
MRRGFILAVLGFWALTLLALVLIAPRRTSTAQPPTPSVSALQILEAPKETNLATFAGGPRVSAIAPANPEVARTDAAVGVAGDEQHEARVAARVAELEELSTKTDRASLETLLSEVKNPDQEIRQAALDAISQSGNRAAIPDLREAAAQATDAREKQAILETVEFLSLPTLTEILRAQGATNNQKPPQRRP